jgi:flagellar biosynthetic protein FlhB
LFGGRALFEFVKSIVKMSVVGIGCYSVARPLYANSLNLIGLDLRAFLPLFNQAVVSLLGVVTLVAVAVAAVDVPYQHWSYRRRHRMSLTEMKDEMKETDGNPHVKGKLRRLRLERAKKRMMHDVKTASVVITNPTHYAVALRYERGKDAAPMVVAKGLDHVAQNIKQVARENNVPVMEDRPLARALHAAVEIGQVIPREHFEAVAKIIGLLWAQKGTVGHFQKPSG